MRENIIFWKLSEKNHRIFFRTIRKHMWYRRLLSRIKFIVNYSTCDCSIQQKKNKFWRWLTHVIYYCNAQERKRNRVKCCEPRTYLVLSCWNFQFCVSQTLLATPPLSSPSQVIPPTIIISLLLVWPPSRSRWYVQRPFARREKREKKTRDRFALKKIPSSRRERERENRGTQ